MTDDQLIDYLKRVDCQAHNRGYQIGFEEGKKARQQVRPDDYDIGAFIEDVAYLPGIGAATVAKMKSVARERGFNVS